MSHDPATMQTDAFIREANALRAEAIAGLFRSLSRFFFSRRRAVRPLVG